MAMNMIFEVSPIKSDGSFITLRMASIKATSKDCYHANQQWLPIISKKPTFSYTFTKEGLLCPMEVSYGEISFRMAPAFGNEVWGTYDWTRAQGRLLVAPHGSPFADYTQIWTGCVSALGREGDNGKVALLGNEALLVQPLLSDKYDGTGGIEGPASLRGTLKPWASGYCQNVDPILVDVGYLTYQVHGYGPVNDIPHVYEFAQDLGSAAATVSTYAALTALTLAPGQWAKAPAIGMFRLGGTPNHKLTCDVVGAKDGSATPLTVTSIIKHLIRTAAPLASFGDLSAFDLIPWSYYSADSVDVGDAVREAIFSAGGYLIPDGLGVWQVGDFYNPDPAKPLKSDRSEGLIVQSIHEPPSAGPVYEVSVGYDRCWSVHTKDEISDTLITVNEELEAQAAAIQAAEDSLADTVADLTLAQTRLAGIGADGILDQVEKQREIQSFSEETAAHTQLMGDALAAQSPAARTAYDTAFSALSSYLGALTPALTNTSLATPIDRTTYKAKWTSLQEKKVLLYAAMAGKAGTIAEWTGVASRPAELTDGRITNGLTNGGLLQSGLWGGAAQVPITNVIGSMAGTQLAKDPEVRVSATCGFTLYNNAGGTKVALSQISDVTAPNGSGKVLRIAYDGTGTPTVNPSPAFGGFTLAIAPSADGISRPGEYAKGTSLYYRIWAKIPVGRDISFASNPTGTDGGGNGWITATSGTGAWNLYVYHQIIGTTGTFSSTGFFYIVNGSNTAFSWDVAKVDALDTTSAPRVFLGEGVSDELGVPRYRADLLTNIGTAAAISGQSGWATSSQPLAKLTYLQSDGTMRLGSGYGLLSSVGGWLTDPTVITDQGTAAAITGQGWGATAAQADVANNSLADGVLRVASPVGGQLGYNGSNTAGAIRIRLPTAISADSDKMIRFTVDIYEYANGATQTYEIAGYLYYSIGSWLNVSARLVGGSGYARPVYFGKDSSSWTVHLGSPSAVWQYPAISIRDLQVSYGTPTQSRWASGWSVGFDSGTPPFTQSVLNPVAGDTIFGVNALETWGGAPATLSNFKTSSGVASGFAGQGALATLNTVGSAQVRAGLMLDNFVANGDLSDGNAQWGFTNGVGYATGGPGDPSNYLYCYGGSGTAQADNRNGSKVPCSYRRLHLSAEFWRANTVGALGTLYAHCYNTAGTYLNSASVTVSTTEFGWHRYGGWVDLPAGTAQIAVSWYFDRTTIGASYNVCATGFRAAPTEFGGDVTATAQHTIGDVPNVVVTADFAGTVNSGQLPLVRSFRRLVGTTDYSPSASYAVVDSSGVTASINNTASSAYRGDVTITAVTAALGSITVSATYGGITLYRMINIQRADAAPPAGGGGGGGGSPGSPASTSSLTNPGSSGTHVTMTSNLAVVVGSSGQVNLTAPLTYSAIVADEFDILYMAAKWQYSSTGSSGWTDVASEIMGDDATHWFSVTVPKGSRNNPGSVSVTQSKTGLTSGSTVYFRLVGRMHENSTSGEAILSVSGTATATPV